MPNRTALGGKDESKGFCIKNCIGFTAGRTPQIRDATKAQSGLWWLEERGRVSLGGLLSFV